MRPEQIANQVVRGAVRTRMGRGRRGASATATKRASPTGSTTETFVAARLGIDNWRWAGVALLPPHGQAPAQAGDRGRPRFRDVPHLPFAAGHATGLGPNTLVLRIQPDEGITLRFGAKVPGQEFRVRTVIMDFSYGAAFVEESPEAYERLLLDAMTGDPTLFIRSDEVQAAWRIWDPVLAAWSAPGADEPAGYAAGTWGPALADGLLGPEHAWRTP